MIKYSYAVSSQFSWLVTFNWATAAYLVLIFELINAFGILLTSPLEFCVLLL